MEPRTVCHLLLSPAAATADRLCERVAGRWQPVSTADYLDRAERLAAGLRTLGIRPGDRVAAWGATGAWWPVVELAVLAHGAVLVPLYPALPPSDAAALARSSGARFFFVDDRERLDQMLAGRERMPAVERYVLVHGRARGDGRSDLETLIGEGEQAVSGSLAALAADRKPEDPAVVFHAFDDAGEARHVVASHGGLVAGVLAAASALDLAGGRSAFCMRPLADAGEHVLHLLYLYGGLTVAYPESPETVDRDLGEVRPHVLSAEPELFKRTMNRVYDDVRRSSRWRQILFRRSVGWGRRALPYRLGGRRPGGLAGLRLTIADRQVFAGIRAHLGGRAERVFSLADPLTRGWITFFWAAGIPVYEGYGTAAAPLVTLNVPGAVELETAGRPLPGVEVRIADDGGILVRGAGVAGGDAGGWIDTGDAGELDGEGFLSVRGRRADLLASADGGRVSPMLIERALAANHFIRRAAVTRLEGGTLAALLEPDFDRLHKVVESYGIDAVGRREILRHGRILRIFEGEVRSINAALAEDERVTAWDLLREDLSVAGGELDPAGGIRRRAVLERRRAELERLSA